jgi:hypothetical protein
MNDENISGMANQDGRDCIGLVDGSASVNSASGDEADDTLLERLRKALAEE